MKASTPFGEVECHAHLHEECLKHHGHRKSKITPGICGTVGERAQAIIMWVKALGIENTSHPQSSIVKKVRPCVLLSSWREDFRMLKHTSFGGVN
jgi:hypothetical protein